VVKKDHARVVLPPVVFLIYLTHSRSLVAHPFQMQIPFLSSYFPKYGLYHEVSPFGDIVEDLSSPARALTALGIFLEPPTRAALLLKEIPL